MKGILKRGDGKGGGRREEGGTGRESSMFKGKGVKGMQGEEGEEKEEYDCN